MLLFFDKIDKILLCFNIDIKIWMSLFEYWIKITGFKQSSANQIYFQPLPLQTYFISNKCAKSISIYQMSLFLYFYALFSMLK